MFQVPEGCKINQEHEEINGFTYDCDPNTSIETVSRLKVDNPTTVCIRDSDSKIGEHQQLFCHRGSFLPSVFTSVPINDEMSHYMMLCRSGTWKLKEISGNTQTIQCLPPPEYDSPDN